MSVLRPATNHVSNGRVDREPLCGAELGRDTIAVLYSAYLSAERRGIEVTIPA